MQFRASIKKGGDWWRGWLLDLPNEDAQERSGEGLIESLRSGAENILALPVEAREEGEELVPIEVN